MSSTVRRINTNPGMAYMAKGFGDAVQGITKTAMQLPYQRALMAYRLAGMENSAANTASLIEDRKRQAVLDRVKAAVELAKDPRAAFFLPPEASTELGINNAKDYYQRGVSTAAGATNELMYNAALTDVAGLVQQPLRFVSGGKEYVMDANNLTPDLLNVIYADNKDMAPADPNDMSRLQAVRQSVKRVLPNHPTEHRATSFQVASTFDPSLQESYLGSVDPEALQAKATSSDAFLATLLKKNASGAGLTPSEKDIMDKLLYARTAYLEGRLGNDTRRTNIQEKNVNNIIDYRNAAINNMTHEQQMDWNKLTLENSKFEWQKQFDVARALDQFNTSIANIQSRAASVLNGQQQVELSNLGSQLQQLRFEYENLRATDSDSRRQMRSDIVNQMTVIKNRLNTISADALKMAGPDTITNMDSAIGALSVSTPPPSGSAAGGVDPSAGVQYPYPIPSRSIQGGVKPQASPDEAAQWQSLYPPSSIVPPTPGINDPVFNFTNSMRNLATQGLVPDDVARQSIIRFQQLLNQYNAGAANGR